MAINLNKGGSSTQLNTSPTPTTQSIPVQYGDPIQEIRAKVSAKVFDGYCDSTVRAEIIRFAVNDLGLDKTKATMATDMELESARCANEYQLLEELDAMLRRFTDKDKKLDQKERADSIQMVCRSRPGFSKGLGVDVAERRVLEFCRAHQVKVKVGFMRWDIP